MNEEEYQINYKKMYFIKLWHEIEEIESFICQLNTIFVSNYLLTKRMYMFCVFRANDIFSEALHLGTISDSNAWRQWNTDVNSRF